MKYLLLFHCNNGCTNAPKCYVIRTLPALLVFCITWRWPLSAEACCKQIPHIYNKPFVIYGGFSLLFLIMDRDRVQNEVRTESLFTAYTFRNDQKGRQVHKIFNCWYCWYWSLYKAWKKSIPKLSLRRLYTSSCIFLTMEDAWLISFLAHLFRLPNNYTSSYLYCASNEPFKAAKYTNNPVYMSGGRHAVFTLTQHSSSTVYMWGLVCSQKNDDCFINIII